VRALVLLLLFAAATAHAQPGADALARRLGELESSIVQRAGAMRTDHRERTLNKLEALEEKLFPEAAAANAGPYRLVGKVFAAPYAGFRYPKNIEDTNEAVVTPFEFRVHSRRDIYERCKALLPHGSLYVSAKWEVNPKDPGPYSYRDTEQAGAGYDEYFDRERLCIEMASREVATSKKIPHSRGARHHVWARGGSQTVFLSGDDLVELNDSCMQSGALFAAKFEKLLLIADFGYPQAIKREKGRGKHWQGLLESCDGILREYSGIARKAQDEWKRDMEKSYASPRAPIAYLTATALVERVRALRQLAGQRSFSASAQAIGDAINAIGDIEYSLASGPALRPPGRHVVTGSVGGELFNLTVADSGELFAKCIALKRKPEDVAWVSVDFGRDEGYHTHSGWGRSFEASCFWVAIEASNERGLPMPPAEPGLGVIAFADGRELFRFSAPTKAAAKEACLQSAPPIDREIEMISVWVDRKHSGDSSGRGQNWRTRQQACDAIVARLPSESGFALKAPSEAPKPSSHELARRFAELSRAAEAHTPSMAPAQIHRLLTTLAGMRAKLDLYGSRERPVSGQYRVIFTPRQKSEYTGTKQTVEAFDALELYGSCNRLLAGRRFVDAQVWVHPRTEPAKAEAHGEELRADEICRSIAARAVGMGVPLSRGPKHVIWISGETSSALLEGGDRQELMHACEASPFADGSQLRQISTSFQDPQRVRPAERSSCERILESASPVLEKSAPAVPFGPGDVREALYDLEREAAGASYVDLSKIVSLIAEVGALELSLEAMGRKSP
jgi:hypothetical protein